MNMKRLLTLVAFFATLKASAQQVNPVPDYVFANRMSAGRNTVTDTAAYFSIGPRYGATRGMMPPMVVDTASFSANKRNGLLIFSVQKNKFLYWDSVGVKWAEMAGTAGTALTSADTAALLSTRAWRQKGIDSLAVIRIGGSGTTDYVPKFTASTTLGNSQIFDNGTNVMINTLSTAGRFVVGGVQQDASQTVARFFANNTSAESKALDININAGSPSVILSAASAGVDASLGFMTDGVERQRIFNNGRVGFNTLSDAGYLVDINGTLRTVNGVVLASGSGNIGLGVTSSPWSFSGNIDMGNDNNLFAGNVAFGFGMNAYYDGAWKYKGTGNASYIKQENGTFQFYTSSSGTAGNTITFTRPMTLTQSAELIINSITDAGAYNLQVAGNIYNTGSITTGAPSGGSIKPWKIGEAATVSPTSPNRTLRVEVDGVVYYIHAKTTND